VPNAPPPTILQHLTKLILHTLLLLNRFGTSNLKLFQSILGFVGLRWFGHVGEEGVGKGVTLGWGLGLVEVGAWEGWGWEEYGVEGKGFGKGLGEGGMRGVSL
jgi:hypothetical protein